MRSTAEKKPSLCMRMDCLVQLGASSMMTFVEVLSWA